jgi:hypothetical protein
VKSFSIFLLLVLVSLPAVAVSGQNVKYVGGTPPTLNPGVIGTFDITSESGLTFQHGNNKLTIPYSSIESSQYSQEVARHMGFLPTVAVCLLKVRQHRHFFRISYHDDHSVEQVAIFEVPKHMPRTLSVVFETRARHSFKSCPPPETEY